MGRFVGLKGATILAVEYIDYVSGMPKNQPQLYYIVGDNVKELKSSPLVESIIAKGYEILYMTDSLDSYLTQSENFKTFDGVTLQNIAKSGVKLGDEGISRISYI